LVKLRLPDELSRSLEPLAAAAGQTPDEWIAAIVRRRLARRDDRRRRHFGAVALGAPTGAEDDQIDADLARA
jgi:hypothetical protein